MFFAAVPLGSLAEHKVKENIWSNLYVDLALLFSDSIPETTFIPTSQSCMHTHSPALESNSTKLWSHTFLVFVGNYTDHSPANTHA